MINLKTRTVIENTFILQDRQKGLSPICLKNCGICLEIKEGQYSYSIESNRRKVRNVKTLVVLEEFYVLFVLFFLGMSKFACTCRL